MVDELDSAAACAQHIYARESASAWRREVAMAVEHGGRLRERGRGDCPEGKRREEKRGGGGDRFEREPGGGAGGRSREDAVGWTQEQRS